MMFKRVVIVTGGSSGIGAATVHEMSVRGWRVVVNYSKDIEKADLVVDACINAGGEAIAVKADVADDMHCQALIKTTIDTWGRIDALVNNAGTTKFVDHANLDGLSAEDFQRIYAVNVIGPFQMCRAASPALKEAKGAIVNVSSLASRKATGSSIAYAASKAALNTVSMSLARTLAPEVRVNVLAPGMVDTPWRLGEGIVAGAMREQYAKISPLKALSSPEDQAAAIAWLIEDAKMITGQILYVDGGMHIR